MIEANISVEQHQCSIALATGDNNFELEILSYIPISDNRLLFLNQVINPKKDAFKYIKYIEGHSSTKMFELIEASPEKILFLTAIDDASAVHAFEESKCFIKPPIQVKNGNKYYTIVAPDVASLNNAYNKLKKLGKWSIDDVHTYQDFTPKKVQLTEMQKKVLLSAKGLGYFDPTHKVSIEDVGKALGISKSTAHHHLAEAKRKLVDMYVDEI